MNKIMLFNSKFLLSENSSSWKYRNTQTLVVSHPFALLWGSVIHLIPSSPPFLPCSVFPAPSSSPAMGHGPGSTWNPIRHIHYLVTTQSRRAPTALLSLWPLYISLSLCILSVLHVCQFGICSGTQVGTENGPAEKKQEALWGDVKVEGGWSSDISGQT